MRATVLKACIAVRNYRDNEDGASPDERVEVELGPWLIALRKADEWECEW